MAAPRRESAGRAVDALASPALANIIGLAGIITPIIAWLTARGTTRNALVAETVIVMLLVGSHIWLRKRYIQLKEKMLEEEPLGPPTEGTPGKGPG